MRKRRRPLTSVVRAESAGEIHSDPWPTRLLRGQLWAGGSPGPLTGLSYEDTDHTAALINSHSPLPPRTGARGANFANTAVPWDHQATSHS